MRLVVAAENAACRRNQEHAVGFAADSGAVDRCQRDAAGQKVIARVKRGGSTGTLESGKGVGRTVALVFERLGNGGFRPEEETRMLAARTAGQLRQLPCRDFGEFRAPLLLLADVRLDDPDRLECQRVVGNVRGGKCPHQHRHQHDQHTGKVFAAKLKPNDASDQDGHRRQSVGADQRSKSNQRARHHRCRCRDSTGSR